MKSLISLAAIVLFAIPASAGVQSPDNSILANVPTGYQTSGCVAPRISYLPGQETECQANGQPYDDRVDGYALIETWETGGGDQDDGGSE